MKHFFTGQTSFLFLLLSSLVLINSVRADVPFPEKVYQIPICASNQQSLKQIKYELGSMMLTEDTAKQFMQQQVAAGNILSSEKLLSELSYLYKRGAANTLPDELERLSARIQTLEARVAEDKNASIYKRLVYDETDYSLYETDKFEVEVLHKLCNGGTPNPSHPFESYQFSVGR